VIIDQIRDENGALIGFAKVTRDITERKQAQEKLAEIQNQLLAAQRLEAVGQLSGGIAHALTI
jgi:C4-dicarboxylate-specific signal transduction histidine kinase